MNPEQLLTSVEECIKERPALTAKMWVICWHEGRLKCLPARTVKNNGNIFGELTEGEIQNGLSLDQWASVAKKMVAFFELLPPKGKVLYMETPQCPDPQKP